MKVRSSAQVPREPFRAAQVLRIMTQTHHFLGGSAWGWLAPPLQLPPPHPSPVTGEGSRSPAPQAEGGTDFAVDSMLQSSPDQAEGRLPQTTSWLRSPLAFPSSFTPTWAVPRSPSVITHLLGRPHLGPASRGPNLRRRAKTDFSWGWDFLGKIWGRRRGRRVMRKVNKCECGDCLIWK